MKSDSTCDVLVCVYIYIKYTFIISVACACDVRVVVQQPLLFLAMYAKSGVLEH